MRFGSALCLVAILNGGAVGLASAVEGGLPAYLLGSRDSLAGVVPPAGTYTGIDLISFAGDVSGLSIAGLPIRAETDVDVNLAKLSITHAFERRLWGGTPAININIPYLLDAELGFTGELPPLAGASIRDTASGIGDVSVTSLLGWHDGFLHYALSLSFYLPTGSYDVARVTPNPPAAEVLNTGKNVLSVQPAVSVTYLNTDTGREASGAVTFLFSAENEDTNFQTAPAFTLETALMQHLPSGWALGLTGYWYTQLGDDSGLGAVATRAVLGASSLSARAFALGPLVTFGREMFGRQTSFKFKYLSEFAAKRRFENDTFWINMTVAF